MLKKNTAAVKKVNGVWLNGKHSYRDYGMFLSERPKIEEPEPRLILIDIPGADGVLDATEAVTGTTIHYKNRTIQLVFVAEVPAEEQTQFVSRIVNELHGQSVSLEFDEDAGWVWSGRAKVTSENLDKWRVKVMITLDAYPYKKSKKQTVVTLDVLDASTTTKEMQYEETYTIPGVYANTTSTVFNFGENGKDFSSFLGLHFKFSSNIQDQTYFGVVTFAFQVDVYDKENHQIGGYPAWFQPVFGEGVSSDNYLQLFSNISSMGARAYWPSNLDLTKITRIVVTADYSVSVVVSCVVTGQTLHITNGKMQTIPTIALSGGLTEITLSKNGIDVHFTETTKQDPNLWLDPFENDIIAKSPVMATSHPNPQITFSFMEGRL